MKFLAALVLSLSLLVSSSFAVSLTPPMVLAMEEDRSMGSADFESNDAEPDFTPFRYLVGGLSIGAGLTGFVLMVMGCATIDHEDENRTENKITIGAGIGLMVLGGVGVFWAF